MMKKYLLIFLLLPFFLSCEEEVPVISEEAESFLNEVLDIMEQNSIKRKQIDWPSLRTEVTEVVGAAQNTSDTYGGIRHMIRNQDTAILKGWIVDLRGNGGGNMWPMLAGVGPILVQGVSGHFIDPNNNVSAWGYDNGKAFINLFTNTQIHEPYELVNPEPKVTVLMDKQVASSGEAIAIAFIGRENTRSFGTESCGLSTSNNSYSLSDNSTLFLTTAFMADRDRNTFGSPVLPDQESTPQSIIEDAINWIEN